MSTNIAIKVKRNKAGLQDFLFGVGSVTQIRSGKEVKITKINAQNLPFDATRNLKEAIAVVEPKFKYIHKYGEAINDIQRNIHAILEVQAGLHRLGGDITGITLTDAKFLEGMTLEEVRGNINAVYVNGMNIYEIRANINAIKLNGRSYDDIRFDTTLQMNREHRDMILKQNKSSAILGNTMIELALKTNNLQIDGVV